MARQTRQQRRDRRAQQEPALAGGPPAAPPRRPVAYGREEPAPRPERRPEARAERLGPVGKAIRFVQESIGELKKVEWPSQRQVIAGTTVVIIACIIVGTFLYVNDRIWQHVVHWLIKV